MIISVINHTSGKFSDAEVLKAIRAINRQIKEDFEPYWSLGATLRLEGKSTYAPIETGDQGQEVNLEDMRGDAVLYLWDKANIPNALGYHDRNFNGIPFGFVFTELSALYNENWTVTLSHEALELIADPEVNLLVQGPHPEEPQKVVFHWYEMCDAVQAETYEVDGVEVSNFVLPLYFTESDEKGSRNDFLGRMHDGGKTLESFRVNPGGYVGFFNPETGRHETYSRKGDKAALERMKIKMMAGSARRAVRYKDHVPSRKKLAIPSAAIHRPVPSLQSKSGRAKARTEK